MKKPVTGQPESRDESDVLELLPVAKRSDKSRRHSDSNNNKKKNTHSDALHRRARELSSTVNRGTPIVDTEKVRAIKAALKNGTYQINANAIADKMIVLEGQLERLDD